MKHKRKKAPVSRAGFCMGKDSVTLHFNSYGYDYISRSQIINGLLPDSDPVYNPHIRIKDANNKYSNRSDLHYSEVEELNESKNYFKSFDRINDDYLLGTHAASKNATGIENVTIHIYGRGKYTTSDTTIVNYEDEIYARTRDQRLLDDPKVAVMDDFAFDDEEDVNPALLEAIKEHHEEDL